MRLIRILIILLMVAFANNARAQNDASYDSVLSGFKYYYNRVQGDDIYKLFSKKLQGNMPLSSTIDKFHKLHEQVGDLKSFRLAYEKDGLVFCDMVFNKILLTLMTKLDSTMKIETFRLVPHQLDSGNSKKSNFFVPTPTGNIYGTLTMPQGMNKIPVVIIIPRSGPTDLNGNNDFGVRANAYKMLADSLNKAGIACLRYDKRGIGASVTALKYDDSLSFDNMISDATELTKLLKQYWRFTNVIILGHSDGALIGMKVAEREKVAGFISISSVAQRVDKIIEHQLKEKSKDLAKKAAVYFDSLAHGYMIHNTDKDLESVFESSVLLYLKTWMQYTPQEEIKKLSIPILILQGTTDLQVADAEAKKLKKSAPAATLTYIEGMNHMLKSAPEDPVQNQATYTNPNQPLCPGLVPAIVEFVREVSK